MIVEKLGYRPLATDHAGAFIHELQIPLPRYLSYYEAAFKKVQSKKPRLGWKYRDETAATTWEASFAAIESENPVASEILLMSSFLNHEGIYDRFFYENEISYDECRQIHSRYSLVTY